MDGSCIRHSAELKPEYAIYLLSGNAGFTSKFPTIIQPEIQKWVNEIGNLLVQFCMKSVNKPSALMNVNLLNFLQEGTHLQIPH